MSQPAPLPGTRGLADEARIGASTERKIRDMLMGCDGELNVLFRVRDDTVSMEVLGLTTTPTAEDPPFARWMSGLIHSRAMSQEAAARMLGVSLKTVNRWVNGRTEPRMRELRRIKEVFRLSPPL